MSNEQVNNPLHGITLKKMVEDLLEYFGWDELGYIINIDCFNSDPSIKSSLKFLRRTDWARKKVEKLYIKSLDKMNERILEQKATEAFKISDALKAAEAQEASEVDAETDVVAEPEATEEPDAPIKPEAADETT